MTGEVSAAAARARKDDKPPNVATGAIMARIVRDHGKAYAPQYAAAFCFMAVASACTALTAWMMKDVVNRIFVDRDPSALIWVPVAILAIFVVKGSAGYLQEVWLSRIGNRIVAETQQRVYDHLLGMDLTFYQQHTSSDLITRITQSARAAREMLNLVAVSLGRDVLTLIGLIVVMVTQDPLLSAICLMGGPVVALSLRSLTKRVKRIASNEYKSAAEVGSTMRQTAQGIRVVKSFQLEEVLRNRMFASISKMERLNNKVVRVQARVGPMVEALAGAAIALGVLYAGWRSLSFGETPGQFFAFLTALLLAADPARRLSKLQLQLARSATGVSIMYELLDTVPKEAHSSSGPALAVNSGEIVFDNVSFAYEFGDAVLDGLSFTAAPGRTTALVGLSGSGKSTILNLMQRFWIPHAGQILIDGQRLDTVSLASLRAQIALVSQDVFLFEGSIQDNIRAGRPGASQEDIVTAARAAHADDFIRSLPNGYDTEVGELGGKVSGGQKQRISLARAFLKDAPIILLDEPTSALDSETELAVQQAMKELTHERTTIVIAHRLATVIDADQILVIEKGQVVETGTHGELIKGGGRYARLCSLQFRGGHELTDVEQPDPNLTELEHRA